MHGYVVRVCAIYIKSVQDNGCSVGVQNSVGSRNGRCDSFLARSSRDLFSKVSRCLSLSGLEFEGSLFS